MYSLRVMEEEEEAADDTTRSCVVGAREAAAGTCARSLFGSARASERASAPVRGQIKIEARGEKSLTYRDKSSVISATQ